MTQATENFAKDFSKAVSDKAEQTLAFMESAQPLVALLNDMTPAIKDLTGVEATLSDKTTGIQERHLDFQVDFSKKDGGFLRKYGINLVIRHENIHITLTDDFEDGTEREQLETAMKKNIEDPGTTLDWENFKSIFTSAETAQNFLEQALKIMSESKEFRGAALSKMAEGRDKDSLNFSI